MKETIETPPFGELIGITLSKGNEVFPDYVFERTSKTLRMEKIEARTNLPIRYLKEIAYRIGIHISTLDAWVKRLRVQSPVDSHLTNL